MKLDKDIKNNLVLILSAIEKNIINNEIMIIIINELIELKSNNCNIKLYSNKLFLYLKTKNNDDKNLLYKVFPKTMEYIDNELQFI